MNQMNIREFYEQWKDVKIISIFGLSHVCKNTINELIRMVTVKCIYDNDVTLEAKEYAGVIVKHFSLSETDIAHEKILVATHYNEISEQLISLGFKENVDFCYLEHFITVIKWFSNNEVYINEVHLSITTKCTLSCEKCNMFMTKYSSPAHMDIERLKEDIDTVFSKVDKVSTFALLGGEPFLYPRLYELLCYLCNNYNDKISTIEMITNGTIIPEADILELLCKKKIFVRISDYSITVKYSEKLAQLINTLEKYSINYFLNSSLSWLDFGFPENPISLPDEKVYQHMLDCSPAFKGINDKKLYYCHIVWSADQCGIYKEKDTDYLNLLKCSKKEVVYYTLGIMENYTSLCKYCAGCASDNKMVIDVAVQKQRDHSDS